MAVHLTLGKLGAGKGAYWMFLLVEELRKTERCIVTNFAIEKLPWCNGHQVPQMGLLAYLLKTYGTTYNAENRIFRIDDEAIRLFYLYRPMPKDKTPDSLGLQGVTNGEEHYCDGEGKHHTEAILWKTEATTYKDKKKGVDVVTDFSTALFTHTSGICYMIDEAWKYWGARNWQETGEGMIYYTKHSRKTGDEVWMATHGFKDIDSAIIRCVQDFHYLRNRGKVRMGLWRQPDKIKVYIFESPPTSPNAEAMRTTEFKLDLAGLHQCYDTTGGVGLSGRMKGDMYEKKAGLPFWTVWVAVGIMALLVWCFLAYGFKFGAKAILPKTSESRKESNTTNFSERVVSGFTGAIKKERETKDKPNETEKTYLIGMVKMPSGNYKVYLSNGEVYNSNEGEIQEMTKSKVVIGGQTYRYKPIKAEQQYGANLPTAREARGW